jgi:hypothetical protein
VTEQITITVYVTGTCAGGHTVGHNLQTTVPKGSSGIANASANCGADGCGKPVLLTGLFSAWTPADTSEESELT